MMDLTPIERAVLIAVQAEPEEWTAKGLAADLDVTEEEIVAAVGRLRYLRLVTTSHIAGWLRAGASSPVPRPRQRAGKWQRDAEEIRAAAAATLSSVAPVEGLPKDGVEERILARLAYGPTGLAEVAAAAGLSVQAVARLIIGPLSPRVVLYDGIASLRQRRQGARRREALDAIVERLLQDAGPDGLSSFEIGAAIGMQPKHVRRVLVRLWAGGAVAPVGPDSRRRFVWVGHLAQGRVNQC